MKTKNFTTTILVDQTPQEAFDAINDVRGWWSGEIEGRTDVLGAEWTYSYKKLHRTTQKITELVPGKKVVWHVTDSQINFVRDKTRVGRHRHRVRDREEGRQDRDPLHARRPGAVPSSATMAARVRGAST